MTSRHGRRRWWAKPSCMAAVIVVLCSATAHAVTRVTIDPPPPFHADEQVRITLTTDDPAVSSQFEVTADNMNLDHQVESHVTHVWVGSFYLTSGTGEIVVRAPGTIEGPRRIPFAILPPLQQPWSDPATELRRLAAANRPPVIVRAELLTPRPLAGRKVTVMWNLYYPVEGAGQVLQPAMDERAKALNLETDFPREPPAMVPIAGMMLWRNNVVRMTFTPERPGRVTIPALTFSNDRMTRLSSALEVDVEPVPAAAVGLPVGRFTIECAKSRDLGYWPRLLTTVRGEGDLDGVREIHTDRAPYAILAKPLPPVSGERRFEVIAHSRTLRKMPVPRLRYFDPIADRVEEVACTDSIRVSRQEHLDPQDLHPLLFAADAASKRRAVPASAEPRAKPPNPEEIRAMLAKARTISLVLAAVGLVGLLLAFRA